MKKISKFLEKIARYSTNTRIIMLSATPIFNDISDIIWLLNILLLNDKRSPIPYNSNVDKLEDEMLNRKLSGYISYLKSSDLSDFPSRLYPNPQISYHREFDSKTNEYNYKWKKGNTQLIYTPNYTRKNLVLCQNVMSNFQFNRYKLTIENKANAFGFTGSDELLIALTEFELGIGQIKKPYITNQIPYLNKIKIQNYIKIWIQYRK